MVLAVQVSGRMNNKTYSLAVMVLEIWSLADVMADWMVNGVGLVCICDAGRYFFGTEPFYKFIYSNPVMMNTDSTGLLNQISHHLH